MKNSFNILKRKVNTFFRICFNHIFYLLHKKPKILTFQKTIDYLLLNHASLSRFGDGELLWALNVHSYFFQKKDKSLSKRLSEIIMFGSSKKMVIAIPKQINLLYRLRKMTMHSNVFYFFWIGKSYRDIYRLFNIRSLYGDGWLNRFYIDYRDKRNKTIDNKINLLKKLWDNRNILIVEGYYSRLGVANDLFDNAISKRRILCPNRNAFDYYDLILNEIVTNYSNNDLVVLSLGPTATVLSYDLQTKYNIQSLDLGHIDIEYEWYIRGSKKRVVIDYKHTAEKDNDASLTTSFDGYDEYINEVISKIIND